MTEGERAGFRRAVAYVFRNKSVAEIRRDYVEIVTVVDDVYFEAIAAVETEAEYQEILKMKKGE